MYKAWSFSLLAFIASTSSFVHAGEYSITGNPFEIHTTRIIQCKYGVSASTKVGYFENGQCSYQIETKQYYYNTCELRLNGGLLEMKVGRGYTCAATHVTSSESEAFDEFKLTMDNRSHYIATQPSFGEVRLK